jgi:antitoxin component YwqK of YwqJK toxin-antitoxin module
MYQPFKTFSSLAIALVCLTSCQQTKSSSSSEVTTETYLHKYGVPLSKSSWKKRGENGQVITTQKSGITTKKSYTEGVLNGPTTQSFPFSDVISKTKNYKQGEQITEVIHYRNGNPQKKKVFLPEHLIKENSWYQTGAPRSIETNNGRWLKEGEYFTLNNTLESKVSNGLGTKTSRDSAGVLLSKEKIENGLTTLKTTYFKNGDPETISEYINGLEEGVKKIFTQGGVPIRIEEWSLGKQHGVTTLFQNGEKKIELIYVYGTLDGIEKRYREGNLLVEEVMWKNNERHGPTYSYLNGKKITYWYLNGRQVSQTIFDNTASIE